MICTRRRRADEEERRARVQEIRDAALTRQALGQAAQHRRLPDGRHEILLYDRQRGVLRRQAGPTLAEAIDLARAP